MELIKKNKIKKLRINSPMLYTYTILGAVFSTIDEKDLPWFYSNFVQIRYSFDWKMLIFDNHINLFQDCPIFSTQYLLFDANYEKRHTFKDTIINILNNNYYIYLFLDWYYIVPSISKKHFAHTTLISGYDLKKNIFTISDNFDNGKFVSLEIDIITVEKAFHSAWGSSVGNVKDNDNSSSFNYLKSFTLFRYLNDVHMEFNKNEFYKQLREYLNSTPFSLFDDGQKYYYGIDSYKAIKESFNGKGNIKIGVRDFHLLYEHKYIMKERIKYMINKKIILDSSLLDDAEVVCNEFLIIRNLYLKFTLSDVSESNIMKKQLLSKLSYSLSKEYNFLIKLLKDFENQNIFFNSAAK
jgi:hypothetical protein